MTTSIVPLDEAAKDGPYACYVISTPRETFLPLSKISTDQDSRAELIANARPLLRFVAEPITAATILIYIAGLILKAVLSEIIASIFKPGGASLEDALREALQKVAEIMRDALEQDRLKKTIDRLRSLERQMKVYAADPIAMRSTLPLMAQTAQDLYADAEGLGLLGIDARAMGATLLTAVYCEIAIVEKSAGVWKYAQDSCGLLAAAIPGLTDDLKARVAARVGPVTYHPKTGSIHTESEPAYWYFNVDQFFMSADTRQEAEAMRAAWIDQRTEAAITNVILPVDGVANKLLELKNRTPPWLQIPQDG